MTDIDYQKLAAAIVDEPDNRVDAEIESWNADLKKLIPPRGSVPAQVRADEVARLRFRHEANVEFEQRERERQEKDEAESRALQRDGARVADYRAAVASWKALPPEQRETTPHPARPAFEVIDGNDTCAAIDSRGLINTPVGASEDAKGFERMARNF